MGSGFEEEGSSVGVRRSVRTKLAQPLKRLQRELEVASLN